MVAFVSFGDSLLNKRFEIKYANPTHVNKKKKNYVWDFDLRKTRVCDYYLLIGMQNNEPSKVFLIPEKEARVRHIRINTVGESKWNIYEITGK